VARIEIVPGVLEDFERILDHLAQFDVADAPARIDGIVDALQVLATSPLIGRKVRAGKRELVIGRGARGYLAWYRDVSGIDVVFVLALRAQRESAYRRHGR
jgi:plasmid stabilization system protein ParE